MKSYIPFSSIGLLSRDRDSIVSFSGASSRTWEDFAFHLSALRAHIRSSANARWILNCDDIYLFACALTAILQCGKEAMLCANTTGSFIDEISGAGTGFLSGQELPGAVCLPALIAASGPTRSLTEDELAFPAIVADDARITLYTSGSTGKPKAFPKRLTELEVEAGELCRIWGDLIEGRRVYSTVNHQHIYGLLFAVLLPLSAGLSVCSDQIRYPESLEALDDGKPVLVCSPAFFKRVAETEITPGLFSGGATIFSSGGVLPEAVAREVERRLGSSPMEIYGSTETGGIAFRKSVAEKAWTPFPRNAVTINEEGRIVVTSPYILDPAGFTCGDLGHYVDCGKFILEGRADSIVKIEEKRISLTEVEGRLAESAMVKESCVIPLAGKRQYLGAVVVLSAEGRAYFADKEKKALNDYFRAHLAQYLEGTVIPKKWRFVEAIPRNAQDKLVRSDIEALFRKGEGITVHSVRIEGRTARVEFTPEGQSVYFDGHFPEYLLLPGVVQCDLAIRFAHENLGTTLNISSIPRMKFKRPIPPDTRLVLSIEHDVDKNRLSYSYRAVEGETVYSDGTVVLEGAPGGE